MWEDFGSRRLKIGHINLEQIAEMFRRTERVTTDENMMDSDHHSFGLSRGARLRAAIRRGWNA